MIASTVTSAFIKIHCLLIPHQFFLQSRHLPFSGTIEPDNETKTSKEPQLGQLNLKSG